MSNGDIAKMANYILKVQKVSPFARLPVYSSAKAAGMDLHAAEDIVIPAGGRSLVSCGFKCAIPSGFYGRVAARSGLAVKKCIDVGAGVIDEDYRGEVKVLLINLGNEGFVINVGDRIAQMIIEKYIQPELLDVAELDSTERGEGGFGSTGVKAN